MTNENFSDQMTVLLNSFNSKAAFGDAASVTEVVLDEYEKSVFLTMAQDEIVVNLYNGNNIYGDSFENTEEMRRYLEELVKTATCDTSTGSEIEPGSVFYTLPDDVAFIVYEQVTFNDSSLGCFNGNIASVYPVTHDEYNKIRKNPFRGPTKFKVLRLDVGENKVELVSKYAFKDYFIRYISKPRPIILEDLPDGLTINGESAESSCQLNSVLHDTILKRAVQLALASKGIQARS